MKQRPEPGLPRLTMAHRYPPDGRHSC